MALNPWIPHQPHPKQEVFLLNDHAREALYGGAAGGGKTDALLMAALQYADVPGYAALILMKSYADLALPKAAMSRAREWLGGTRARPVDGGRAWQFPSGASLTFGYLDHVGDEQRYRTAEFHYIGFDELTRFPEAQYTFMFSRQRRPKDGPLAAVPVRMRAATNPGDKYGEWVKQRFIPDDYLRDRTDAKFGRVWWKPDAKDPGKVRLFVPAKLRDNPTLDAAEYLESLDELLPVVKAQLKEGDWGAHEDGHMKREWFPAFDDLGDAYYLPHTGELAKKEWCQVLVTMDPAGGESQAAKYTAIPAAAVTPGGSILIIDVFRERVAVERVVPALADVCRRRRPAYVGIEGGFLQSAYVRGAQQHKDIPTVRVLETEGQSKLVRATPLIIRASNKQIFVPRSAPWLDAFLDELCSFTGDDRKDAYTDQVDATAYVVTCVDRFRGRGDDGPVTLGRRGQ